MHDSFGVTGRCAAMPAFLCECWHLTVCGRVCLNNLSYSEQERKIACVSGSFLNSPLLSYLDSQTMEYLLHFKFVSPLVIPLLTAS